MKPISPLRIGVNQGAAVSAGVPILSFDIYAKSVRILAPSSSDQATATVTVNGDGTITATQNNLAAGQWHTNPASGLGASYWIILTASSGTLTSGTSGSRVQLTNGTTWTAATSGSSSLRRNQFTGTFEIWDASVAGNLMSSGIIVIEAEVQASQAYVPGTDNDFTLTDGYLDLNGAVQK